MPVNMCEEGYESDRLSNNCAVPVWLNTLLGCLCISLLPIAALLMSYRVNMFSSKGRFWAMTFETQMTVIGFISWMLGGALLMGPLAYDQNLNNSTPSYMDVFALFLLFVGTANTACGSIRSVRRGLKNTFILSPNLPKWMKRLTQFEIAHVMNMIFLLLPFGVVQLMGFFSDTPTSNDRRLFTLPSLILIMGPLIIMRFVALQMALVALKKLPQTDQSLSVRRRLEKFRLNCRQHLFYVAIVFCFWLMCTVAFAEYTFVCYGVTTIIVACIMMSKKKRKARHSHVRANQIAVQPSQDVQSLSDWEERAQAKAPSGKVPEVPGISLAALTLFAQENNIPDDASMNEVCVIIKSKTKLNASSHAYIEIIQEGQDATGQRFVGTATHFFSYAWKYSWKVVFTAIQSFESTGSQGHYYMIDQVATCISILSFLLIAPPFYLLLVYESDSSHFVLCTVLPEPAPYDDPHRHIWRS